MFTPPTTSDEDSDFELDDSSFYEEKPKKKRKATRLTKSKRPVNSLTENSGKKRSLVAKTQQTESNKRHTPQSQIPRSASASSSSYSETSDSEESALFADPIHPTPSVGCEDDWEEDVYAARIHTYHNTHPIPSPYLLTTPYNTKMCADAWERLYPYQKEGCGWMYGLYREGV
ncbi:hypothetical protein EON63_08205, partial [archaeon]